MDEITSGGVERADALERSAARLDAWLGAHRRSYLIFATGLCALTFSGYSYAKFPWVDELLMMTIARLGGVKDIWAALMDGIQIDPPVLHSTVHFLFRLFGDHVFLARLPAIAGFTLMCVSLACLVWRHAPPLYAAATFFLPYATVLRVWSMDARPYGLMMGFSALTLLCWDGMEDSRRRTAWRIGFTLSLAAALSTHFYSILLLLPLGMGELAKWVFRKRPDWRTLVCIALALLPYMLWSPILLSGARRFMKHYFYKAAFNNFYDFFSFAIASLPMAGILLLLIVAVVLLGRLRREAVARQSLSDRQRVLLAAAVGFLLLPLVGFAAGVLITGFFVPYYHIITAFGVILGLPLLLPEITARSHTAGVCLFLAVMGHGLFVTARGLSGFVRGEARYTRVSEMRKLIPEPRPDIVIPSPAAFLPLHEANRTDPLNSLVYLFDPVKQLEELGTDVADIVYEQLRGRTPARLEQYDAFVASHRRFYIAVLGESKGLQEWQFRYLLTKAHARLWWLGKVGDFDLFRVDLDSR